MSATDLQYRQCLHSHLLPWLVLHLGHNFHCHLSPITDITLEETVHRHHYLLVAPHQLQLIWLPEQNHQFGDHSKKSTISKYDKKPTTKFLLDLIMKNNSNNIYIQMSSIK